MDFSSYINSPESRNKPYVIAEVGFNHDGRPEKARKIVEEVAATGADCVKFQLFNPELLLSDRVDSEVRKTFENHRLGRKNYKQLVGVGEECGIEVAASVFDLSTLEWYLQQTSPPFIKIASGDITFRRLLEAAGRSGTPVALSTGAATTREISRALRWLGPDKKPVLLHCTPEYPTAESELNLARLRKLAEKFELPVGFSDHSQSVQAPALATSLGAVVWERHVTPDPGASGPEHSFSLPTPRLKTVLNKLGQSTPKPMGGQRKKMIGESEPDVAKNYRDFRQAARRSLAAAEELEAGQELNNKNIIELRPARGLPANVCNRVLGNRVTQHLQPGELIEAENVENY